MKELSSVRACLGELMGMCVSVCVLVNIGVHFIALGSLFEVLFTYSYFFYFYISIFAWPEDRAKPISTDILAQYCILVIAPELHHCCKSRAIFFKNKMTSTHGDKKTYLLHNASLFGCKCLLKAIQVNNLVHI